MGGNSAGAQWGAQREVMSLSALSSSSLMALYFIFCAYTSSAGGGWAGGRRWSKVGGWAMERERGCEQRVEGSESVRTQVV